MYKKCGLCYKALKLNAFNAKNSRKCISCINLYWLNRKNRNEKQCAKCEELKFIKDFHRNKKTIDGRTSYCKQCIKDYRENNKLKIQKRETKYRKKRLKKDPKFRLMVNIRTRLCNVLRGEVKPFTTKSLIGCSLNQLRDYLESKFSPGMNWDNYSHSGWHVDHIIPLSSFDLTDENQIRKACHFTNLQPLWAITNYKKSNKLIF